MNIVRYWFKRHLSDPQIVILAVLLLLGFFFVAWFGSMLIPILAALVIAYLLEGLVLKIERLRVPRMLAVLLVFLVFLTFYLNLLIVLVPYAFQQLLQLVRQFPIWIDNGQLALMDFLQRHPDLVGEEQMGPFVVEFKQKILTELRIEERLTSAVVIGAKLGGQAITLLIYFILVPILVLFMMKDKVRIHNWFGQFMPQDRKLVSEIWEDVDQQLGNYVRGKFIEILVVGVTSYAAYRILDLNYAVLLAVFTGLSVLIPYVGATMMTLPVALVALNQWGYGSEFLWTVGTYLVLQMLDGNLLAPLLFSEVTSLHPIAVIAAVLVFGGLWGFWGVFFAIPLATLVQAIIKAWPAPPPPSHTHTRRPPGSNGEARNLRYGAK